MIARMQINQENRKFVVHSHREFYLEGPSSAAGTMDGAKVYDSEQETNHDKEQLCAGGNWEVEQIVVC